MLYDFTTLSPSDFEQLAADLLSKEWGTRLEIFKAGKDGGIDLLNSRVPFGEPKTIVQCKRYGPEKFTSLLSSMKKERVKLDKLKPQRYVLVTSVPLSNENKEKLLTALTPHCHTKADIYGGDEVNSLLRSFPDVEQAHFKLWISSTAVLSRVMHSKIFSVTEATLDATLSELRKLVPHSGLNRALGILNDNGHVLIVGNPGIGKTTLARMLLCHFIREEYEPVWVVGNIDEAWSLVHEAIKGNRKIILVYDDFLGQLKYSSERLDKNEDNSLFLLMEKVSKTNNIRLILTTREYILEDAKITHGAFSTRSDELKKCTVSVEDYGTDTRSKMLFNHLYFSDLPANRMTKVLETKIYAEILRHRNFNPRIIETISKNANSRLLDDDAFIEYIEQEFENPAKLWAHPFAQEISVYSQQLLVVLWSYRRATTLPELQNLIETMNPTELPEVLVEKFKNSLRQLDGNFISTDRLPEPWHPDVFKHRVARFQNPSVREFIENMVVDTPIWLVRIAENLRSFDQVKELLEAADAVPPDSIPERFWPVLRASVLRVEGTKRKYEMNCARENGITYPALCTEDQRSAEVALALLKIDEQVRLNDDCAQKIMNRVVTPAGWSKMFRDMARSYNVHSLMDDLIEWIHSESGWDNTIMASVTAAYKAAMLDHLDDGGLAADMWNMNTLSHGIDLLAVQLSVDERTKLFSRISEGVREIVREDDSGVLKEQLDLLEALEKNLLANFTPAKEILQERISEVEETSYERKRANGNSRRYSNEYENNKLNVDDLFKGLLDRDVY